jgi:hypothetical protein
MSIDDLLFYVHSDVKRETARWRVSFWRFFYGLRIILTLFHIKETSFVYRQERFSVVELPAER